MAADQSVVLFAFAVLFFIAVLAVFITIIVLVPKQVVNAPPPLVITPNGPAPRGLEKSFVDGDGAIRLSSDEKPFVVALTKNGPVKNALVFANLHPSGSSFPVETQPGMSRGFTFAVTQETAVVALQVVDQFFESGSRSVGIYSVSNKQLLVQATISKQDDPVTNGLRTHSLVVSEYVRLLPGVLYAAVGLVLQGDLYAEEANACFPINTLAMDDAKIVATGAVGNVRSDVLALPSNFAPLEFCTPFASFQVQQQNVPNTKVFEVDTQFARFPPQYINALNVRVLSPVSLLVSSGYANSMYNETNLILKEDLIIVADDLEPKTWYAVYIGAPDGAINGNNAQVYLSQNFNELPALNTTRARRVGWVRTKNDVSDLILMQQQGDNVRRSSFFLEPFVFFNLLTSPLEVNEIVVLDDVPPTATSCVFEIEVEFQTFPPPSDPISLTLSNQTITLTSNQTYQLVLATVPLTVTSVPPQMLIQTNFAGYTGAGRLILSVVRFVDDL